MPSRLSPLPAPENRGVPGSSPGLAIGDAATRGVRVQSAATAADGLIIDLYLEGAPPYPRLTLPPMPGAVLIVNLGPPFRIRAGPDIEAAEYADGVVLTTPTRALEFGYPPGTRSIGVHFKPWGLAPFLPMPAADARPPAWGWCAGRSRG